jgi:hypothetical protein
VSQQASIRDELFSDSAEDGSSFCKNFIILSLSHH